MQFDYINKVDMDTDGCKALMEHQNVEDRHTESIEAKFSHDD